MTNVSNNKFDPAPDVPVKDLPRITESELKSGLYVNVEEAGFAIGGTGNTVKHWLRSGLPRTEEPLVGMLPKPRRKSHTGAALWLKEEWELWRDTNINAKAPNIEGIFKPMWRKSGKMNSRKGAK